MRTFIHRAGSTELALAELEPGTTVAELAAEHGDADALVFAADSEEPLEPSLTLEAVGVRDDGHLHIGRCRRVRAKVNYKEDSKRRTFPPNVAMEAVFAWAAGPKGFDLSATDKAEHMLIVTGTETQVDEDAHLGAYAEEECRAELDLVPKHRFEG